MIGPQLETNPSAGTSSSLTAFATPSVHNSNEHEPMNIVAPLEPLPPPHYPLSMVSGPIFPSFPPGYDHLSPTEARFLGIFPVHNHDFHYENMMQVFGAGERVDPLHLCEPLPMKTQLGAQLTHVNSDDGAVDHSRPPSIYPQPVTFPHHWHEIPQKLYGPGRKQLNFSQLESIFFQVNGSPGVNMGDALRKKFVGLEGRDDLVLHGTKAISCRFSVHFLCYPPLYIVNDLRDLCKVPQISTQQVIAGRNSCSSSEACVDCDERFLQHPGTRIVIQ